MVRVRTGRGFSLLELLVAGTIFLFVVAAATEAFTSLKAAHRRDLERSRLRAQADLALSTLARDLRHAGLGLPEGGNVSSGAAYTPAVFLAEPTRIGFMGDLPRPDVAFNGYSELAGDQPPGASMVVLLNELSGGCGSDTSSSCRTELMSLAISPAGVPGCGASGGAPTCPWAQRRYRAGEAVTVVNGLGAWAQMTVAPGLFDSAGGRRGLALTAAPTHLSSATQPRRGFVSTPDRVFYRLSGDSLERAQCWAGPGTADACVTTAQGTGWETLARNVTGFLLQYQRADGSAIARASQTRRVSVRLELTKAAADARVRVAEQTTVALRR